jgi:RNA polymerase sigma factor (sigma-70 family)
MQDLRAIQGGVHSDLELIERYKKTHNNEILGVLYERYMHLVYGTCLKYLKDSEAAKDAVMNIFEELMTKLRTHQVDNFRSWLFVVSKNHCLMQLRKESRTLTTEIPVSLMQSEEEIHLNGVMEKEKHPSPSHH